MTRNQPPTSERVYLALADETFVMDLVPSEMARLANLPGRIRQMAVWISRDEIVNYFEYDASSTRRHVDEHGVSKCRRERDLLEASVAMCSKISFTNEFKMAIALLEIPVSGWTCAKAGMRDENRTKLAE